MQDDLEQAQNFVAATGIQSFPVVWSESFNPAALLGVTGHPQWVLLTRSGEIAERGFGGIDADRLLELAASI